VFAPVEGDLVVVSDFDFPGISCLPSKTDAVLIIDPNAVLPLAKAVQLLQPVSRRDRQLSELANPIQLVQLAAGCRPHGTLADAPCRRGVGTIEYVLRSSVAKGAYHGLYYNG
jgi:hypothetical protein